MTGKTNTDLSSVLPLDERIARIAAGGESVVSLRAFPAEKNKSQEGYYIGSEPDELDLIVPRAAGSRTTSSLSVPVSSVHSLNRIPT